MMGIAFLALFIASVAMGWIGSFYSEMSHIAFWTLDAAIGVPGALIAWLIRRPLERRLGIQPSA